MPTDANRRRNQIIAERTMLKTRDRADLSSCTERRLWDYVQACIDSDLHTRRWLGQVQKGVEAVYADLALEELQLRGTQLELFTMPAHGRGAQPD